MYRELVVEANTQLGYLTMPEELFAKYKEIIKITSYDAMRQVLGEDPRKMYKREMIRQENEEKRMVYT